MPHWSDLLQAQWQAWSSVVAPAADAAGASGWTLLALTILLVAELPRCACSTLALLARRLAWSCQGCRAQAPPSCSALIVCRNQAEALPAAIDGMLNGCRPDELIVLDDGSTDGTHAVARAYADRGQIRLFRCAAASRSLAQPATPDLVLGAARGEILLRAAAEARLEPGCLRRMLAPFADPAVGVVLGTELVDHGAAAPLGALQRIDRMLDCGLDGRCCDRAVLAFRQQALQDVGIDQPALAATPGLDPISALRQADWLLRHAPTAIVRVEAPASVGDWLQRRMVEDARHWRSAWRELLSPAAGRWRQSLGAIRSLVRPLGSLGLVAGLLWLATIDPILPLAALIAGLGLGLLVAAVALPLSLTALDRWRQDGWMLALLPLVPLHALLSRLLQVTAILRDLFQLDLGEPCLPDRTWRAGRSA